ncbi:MAG: TRAP transporter small permease subunit [Nitrospinota bacterium]
MDFLRAVSRSIDTLNERVGRGVRYGTLVMVLVTVVDVLMRYLFKAGSVGIQELEWHLFGVVFLLGAAYTLLHDEHVRVDIFYARMSVRGKARVDLFGALFFCIPLCILVIATSWSFVISSWQFWEGSPDPGGLPARYLLKTAVPVGFLLVALQGLSMAASSLRVLMGEEEDGGKGEG